MREHSSACSICTCLSASSDTGKTASSRLRPKDSIQRSRGADHGESLQNTAAVYARDASSKLLDVNVDHSKCQVSLSTFDAPLRGLLLNANASNAVAPCFILRLRIAYPHSTLPNGFPSLFVCGPHRSSSRCRRARYPLRPKPSRASSPHCKEASQAACGACSAARAADGCADTRPTRRDNYTM